MIAAEASSDSIILEQLLKDGRITDPDKAYERLWLGYPAFMVLAELGATGACAMLSTASGVRMFDEELSGLQSVVDIQAVRQYGATALKARRWVPLVGDRIAIADPFGALPDGILEHRDLCLVPVPEIDALLRSVTPDGADERNNSRRLGRLLIDAGAISERDLLTALQEQARSGGRLGENLIAQGIVGSSTLVDILSKRLAVSTIDHDEEPVPLLPRAYARSWRVVALASNGKESVGSDDGTLPVAATDPNAVMVEELEAHLQRPVELRLTDDETLNELLGTIYAEDDILDATRSLAEQNPSFSAYHRKLSRAQLGVGIALGSLLLFGAIAAPMIAIVAIASLCTTLYFAYPCYRLYAAWRGWRDDSTIHPTEENIRSLDERELPMYTVLLPLYKERPSTVQTLFAALSALDYPKHKLDGLLLIEADDHQTQEAIKALGKPAWLRILRVPPGEPRTKPRAMNYGLLYARGELLTVYDAEDKPEPDQLKKAVWGLRHLDRSVACLQAKLNYYNPRQNVLTRWFTLEYNAWFDLFLPGLHQMDAPIPLGGTSNHFRVDVLKESLSWDPYNVTEDADLGLRLPYMRKHTIMLDSTTYEEANSRVGNWLRQRSRWIKGYMQTFLVHTRHPVALYRQVGLKSSLLFLATIGGLIFTVLISPIFWALLAWWLLAQPGWIPLLFPGPVYYLALVSLLLGNFLFVFLGLLGAMSRGDDDITPYSLLVPIYWAMMSAAGYLAAYELIVRPFYWQKTEHGLHQEDGKEAQLPVLSPEGRREEASLVGTSLHRDTVSSAQFEALLDKISARLVVLLEEASAQLGAERSSLMVLDRATNTFSVVAGRSLPASVVTSTPVDAGEGVAGWVAQSRRPIIINGHGVPGTLARRLTQTQLRASIVLPIRRSDITVAVLSVSSAAATFGEDELRWLNGRVNRALSGTAADDR